MKNQKSNQRIVSYSWHQFQFQDQYQANAFYTSRSELSKRRRKWFYILLSALTATSFLFTYGVFYYTNTTSQLDEEDFEKHDNRTCRNTVQGPIFVTDEKGYFLPQFILEKDLLAQLET
jgi:hypothetical protein